MLYQGFHTDYAITRVIGKNKDEKIQKFLKTGEETLYLAIKEAKMGNRIGKEKSPVMDILSLKS